MLLHDALETFALGASDHVNQIASSELTYVEVDSAIEAGAVWKPELANELLGLGVSLLEVAEQRLGHALFLLRIEAYLDRRVAVVVLGLYLLSSVATGFDDGNGRGFSLLVIDAGHANLLA
jgi:hypothetical protein